MRKILGLSLLFLQFASHLLGQSIFYTQFKYELTWENNVWQSLVDTKFKGVPGNGYFCQVKWDPNQLKLTGYNPIIAFLYQRIQDRKQRAWVSLNGPELTHEELIDLAYWRKSIHACTGDWISSYEPDEIKYLKLHQQWYVDATGHTLKNKVLGVTPIRVDEEHNEVEMFYLPMENEMTQNVLNQQTVVYIRLLYNMLAFEEGSQDLLLNFIDTHREKCTLESQRDDFVYTANDQTITSGEVMNNISKTDRAFYDNLQQFTQGIGIKQYLYIDFSRSTINSSLSAISPIFFEWDEGISFTSCTPFCWLDTD
ncbi:MAG TPA: hypothetical protein PLC27_10985 [Saprospiraceae bacterium]|nr:hypothetical protein [Saprospiraceae bacterium]HRG66765.1 hypothetical protein [Saprospiraceae bacterium]